MKRLPAIRGLTIAAATVGVALGAVAVAPVASADVLGDIRGAVNGARGQSTCAPLNYSIQLEGDAQAFAGNSAAGVPPAGRYKGEERKVIDRSDPANIGGAVDQIRGVINDCSFKDFGVGFVRDRNNEVSITTIVLGKPPEAPKQVPPVQCPAGSPTPTVPAGQQCAPVPVPDVTCPPGSTTPTVPAGQSCTEIPAPANAVTMNIAVGFGTSNVDIASSADIPGSCTYNATSPGLPSVNRSFDLAPKGSTSFGVLSPPLLTKYRVVLSCKGQFNGKTVEFGHVEQDVTALG